MSKLITTKNYEEKKSKFICFGYVLENEEDSSDIMKKLKSEHSDAKHILHVCRYLSHLGSYVLEASDDKEPISSMKKTSRYFEKDNIKNFGIYIVRYYGGKELGASHLDHVYFTLAMDTFNEFKKIEA